MIQRLTFTPDQIRIAVIGGATVLAAGLIGTTAALATSFGRPPAPEAELAPAGARTLTIQMATPAPLLAPPPVQDGERFAVLTDAPADLAYDSDLRGSLDMASLRATDAADMRRAAAETASWERRSAGLQKEIDAAGRYPYAAAAEETGQVSQQHGQSSDADVAAAAGDTRSGAGD